MMGEILNKIKKINKSLSNYKHFISICFIIILGILIVVTIVNFQKQNEIIKTGGFTDGKIKCVCNEERWNQFQSLNNETNTNFSKFNINGKN